MNYYEIVAMRGCVHIHKSARKAVFLMIAVAALLCLSDPVSGKNVTIFSDDYGRLNDMDVRQLHRMGIDYKKKGDLDSALICYIVISGKYTDKIPQSERHVFSSAYNDIGIIYFTKSEYSESFEAFMKAAELADSASLPGIYNNIASLYYYFDDYESSWNYLQKAYVGCLKYDDESGLYNTVRNIIDFTMTTDRLKDSGDVLSQYCDMTAGSDSPEEVFTRRLCFAVGHIVDKDYVKAVESFRDALDCTGKIWQGKTHEATVYSYIAKTYLMAGDTVEAVDNLIRCMRIADANGINEILVDTYKRLGDLYAVIGNMADADRYRMKYLEYKDSIFSVQELRRMKDFRFNNEVYKYRRKVEALNAANERHSIIATSVSAGMLAVLVSLIWIYRQYRIQKQKNVALYTKNVQLLQMENAERKSRNKFAMEVRELRHRISELEKGEVDGANDKAKGDKGKYQGSSLTDYGKNILAERIRKVFDSPEIFCSEGFSIEKLSELVGSNTGYVSQVINEVIGTNFNSLLNTNRINEACRRLEDSGKYGNWTLEAVAQSVGYKSRSHFSRIFKSMTGLSPSVYQEMARARK